MVFFEIGKVRTEEIMEKRDISDIVKKIREYISDNFMMGANDLLISDSDSFLGAGILDSTGIIEIVAFIEDEFDIEMTYEEIVPENLDSIKSIETYVLSKRHIIKLPL